eukprot:221281-Hanusia_phi.AAC.1
MACIIFGSLPPELVQVSRGPCLHKVAPGPGPGYTDRPSPRAPGSLAVTALWQLTESVRRRRATERRPDRPSHRQCPRSGPRAADPMAA